MRLFAVALFAVTVSQPFSGYSGVWTAVHDGTTYVRLKLEDARGAPQGEMSICETVHVDDQGDIDRVTEAPQTLTRMQDIHWSGAVLSFSIKSGDEVDRFELGLIDANTGELTPIITEEQRQELAKEGIPLPKPFRVTKAR